MPEQITTTYDPTARVFNVDVAVTALPQGGNTGDVLVKASNISYAYTWASLSSLAGTSFDTVQDMLDSDTTTWLVAVCDNYQAADNWISLWVKTNNEVLQENGSDVRVSTDGSTLIRLAVKEYTGVQTVIPASLTPFSFGVIVAFPTYADMLNSTNNDFFVVGPDSVGQMGGWTSGAPSGVAGRDYITNAAAHTWIRAL